MTATQSPSAVPSFYARKLYALLQDTIDSVGDNNSDIFDAIPALRDVDHWWQANKEILKDISSASDRVSLKTKTPPDSVEARHPISGQNQFFTAKTGTKLTSLSEQLEQITNVQAKIKQNLAEQPKSQTEESEEQLRQLFFWCWRFYPELRDTGKLALINPAHRVLPDCPIPSSLSAMNFRAPYLSRRLF